MRIHQNLSPLTGLLEFRVLWYATMHQINYCLMKYINIVFMHIHIYVGSKHVYHVGVYN